MVNPGILSERLQSLVASPLVTIVDDPLILGAPGSRPFDGDGLPSRRNVVVNKGQLATFLLDTYSARKLKSKSTGSAAGITGTGAGTSNFFMLRASKAQKISFVVPSEACTSPR